MGRRVDASMLLYSSSTARTDEYACEVLRGALQERGVAASQLARARLSSSGFVLEDQVLASSEELNRICASASLARELATGRLDTLGRFDEGAVTWDTNSPWVDQRASTLLGQLGERTTTTAHRFRVIITHDVDRTTALEPTAFASALLKSLRLRGAPCLGPRFVLSPRALVRNVERLLEFEHAQRVGAYYFMMSGPYRAGRHGTRTDIRWRASRNMVRLVSDAGMTVGLHGSFHARECGSYGEERERLEQVTCRPVTMHRNHYLRFSSERLANQLEAADITHDFSVGFRSRIGFRAGLGRVYPAFDWVRQHTARLRLVPLLFMDNLLLGGDVSVLFKKLCDALQEVKQVGGCVSLLFHPETFLIAPETWSFFQRTVAWCLDAGADLSGCLDAAPAPERLSS